MYALALFMSLEPYAHTRMFDAYVGVWLKMDTLGVRQEQPGASREQGAARGASEEQTARSSQEQPEASQEPAKS